MGLSHLIHKSHSDSIHDDDAPKSSHHLHPFERHRQKKAEKAKVEAADILFRQQQDQAVRDAKLKEQQEIIANYCEYHNIDLDEVSEDEGVEEMTEERKAHKKMVKRSHVYCLVTEACKEINREEMHDRSARWRKQYDKEQAERQARRKQLRIIGTA
ncbi:MAG: hypothetical protein Q9218_004534 [Villophora microphyllina]